MLLRHLSQKLSRFALCSGVKRSPDLDTVSPPPGVSLCVLSGNRYQIDFHPRLGETTVQLFQLGIIVDFHPRLGETLPKFHSLIGNLCSLDIPRRHCQRGPTARVFQPFNGGSIAGRLGRPIMSTIMGG